MKIETIEIYFKNAINKYNVFFSNSPKKINLNLAIKYKKNFDVKFAGEKRRLCFTYDNNEYTCKYDKFPAILAINNINDIKKYITDLFNFYIGELNVYYSPIIMNQFLKECNKVYLIDKTYNLFDGNRINMFDALENEVSFMITFNTFKKDNINYYVIFNEKGMIVSERSNLTTKYSREKFDIYKLMDNI